MVKMIATLKRKPGMTRKEFSDYWRYHHAPLVQSVPEFARYLRKYVQNHVASDLGPTGSASEFDGVAELWFDSAEDLAAAFAGERYLEIVRPDELKFLDFDATIVCVTEEIPICGA
jgi:uncharacterized protein (TIGR02118 family)